MPIKKAMQGFDKFGVNKLYICDEISQPQCQSLQQVDLDNMIKVVCLFGPEPHLQKEDELSRIRRFTEKTIRKQFCRSYPFCFFIYFRWSSNLNEFVIEERYKNIRLCKNTSRLKSLIGALEWVNYVNICTKLPSL